MLVCLRPSPITSLDNRHTSGPEDRMEEIQSSGLLAQQGTCQASAIQPPQTTKSDASARFIRAIDRSDFARRAS